MEHALWEGEPSFGVRSEVRDATADVRDVTTAGTYVGWTGCHLAAAVGDVPSERSNLARGGHTFTALGSGLAGPDHCLALGHREHGSSGLHVACESRDVRAAVVELARVGGRVTFVGNDLGCVGDRVTSLVRSLPEVRGSVSAVGSWLSAVGSWFSAVVNWFSAVVNWLSAVSKSVSAGSKSVSTLRNWVPEVSRSRCCAVTQVAEPMPSRMWNVANLVSRNLRSTRLATFERPNSCLHKSNDAIRDVRPP